MSIRALIVGGTSGIGRAMANRIASDPSAASVIVSGRKKPDSLPHANMEFRPVEATSMRSLKQLADSVRQPMQEQGQALNFLIFTQGILTMAPRTETTEGIDRKMALHYYGRQLLIRELLPVLAEDAKVLIIFDSIRGTPEKLNWDDLDLKKTYSVGNVAQHCMAMNDGMVQWFAKQQELAGSGQQQRRQFIHAFPRMVKTEVWKNLPVYLRVPARGLGLVMGSDPDDFAQLMLRAAAEVPEDKFWHNLEHRGLEAQNRPIWNDEQMNRVADHTWELVDGALKVVS
jgi:NAD(P)-dependent dehydrogenase (short-subunit alcohol dehydrogenase family)